MKLTVRHLLRGTGQHRACPRPQPVFPPAPHAAVAPQAFVHCGPCGVETAATVHGSTLLCAEGHTVPAGGAS